MDIESYTNREVEFSYCGNRLTFALSHGLFSSGGVDVGTKLLLKTLAPRLAGDAQVFSRVVDVGSGTGVIGICCAKILSDAVIELQDRDALAVAFSHYNATKNSVGNCVFRGGLAFEIDDAERGANRYDLILSNVPAKMGTPVLSHFCLRTLQSLEPDGLAAFVVVNTIADFIAKSIVDLGGRISLTETGPGHTVYHFCHENDPVTPAPDEKAHIPGTPGFDSSYIRNTGEVELSSRRRRIKTVYGLPEFDTPSFATILAASEIESAMRKNAAPDRALFWESRQGHLPLVVSHLNHRIVVTLAGRDALGLAITAENLAHTNSVVESMHHLPSILDVADVSRIGKFSLIVIGHDPVPGAPIATQIVSAAKELLQINGRMIVAGSSQEMHRVQTAARGLRLLNSRKHRGFRVLNFSLSS